MVVIDWIHGRPANGADDDAERAAAAADSVLAKHGATDKAAFAVYREQWEKYDDESPMHGLALVWIEARAAANLALTEGWHNPDGAHCDIEAI